ncbi:SHOCT domain-containing protein [Candidatus Pelagibacter sp.]|nr:SHOCT domain-containing protein [Candidatus Pelagibacter sp.]MDA9146967.1 SHOCT domain-containing protein [bacterium]MDA9210363.1 SHOCT domain-containing protein [bacterium]MDB3889641.1 SHOCT domain-containing protein [Candidatus Pelagibacter sp.]MDB3987716.1 SHOCT domain-containing protein [Candidatus Pelagibacter sp.]
MEKIIFFGLALPILGFVFYLGGTAIMKGFKAKVDNRPVKPEEVETGNSPYNNNDLSSEISKLNELQKNGVLTQEEFEKAKSKLLNN